MAPRKNLDRIQLEWLCLREWSKISNPKSVCLFVYLSIFLSICPSFGCCELVAGFLFFKCFGTISHSGICRISCSGRKCKFPTAPPKRLNIVPYLNCYSCSFSYLLLLLVLLILLRLLLRLLTTAMKTMMPTAAATATTIAAATSATATSIPALAQMPIPPLSSSFCYCCSGNHSCCRFE